MLSLSKHELQRFDKLSVTVRGNPGVAVSARAAGAQQSYRQIKRCAAPLGPLLSLGIL